jgi:hypothetical protein
MIGFYVHAEEPSLPACGPYDVGCSRGTAMINGLRAVPGGGAGGVAGITNRKARPNWPARTVSSCSFPRRSGDTAALSTPLDCIGLDGWLAGCATSLPSADSMGGEHKRTVDRALPRTMRVVTFITHLLISNYVHSCSPP